MGLDLEYRGVSMGVRYFKKVSVLSLAVLLASTAPAFAASGMMAGTMLNNVTRSISTMPDLFSAAAYLLGLLFAITGIFKFKDHVDEPRGHPLSAGVKRFIAAGMLFAAPFMSTAVKGTVDGTGGSLLGITTNVSGASGLTGMDKMITGFITNIAGPSTTLLTAFAYISAIVFLIVGITRLTKTEQEGPRGPTGLGTIMTFIASGALFSFGDMAGAFSNSLFGTSSSATFATISSTVLTTADAAQVEPVIQSLMIFVMIVGLIAFVRGLFVLKAFADGSQQASLAQALTFLIGGTMAINLGQLINLLQNTVGVSGITFS